MAEPESPDPESGSDSRHGGEESDPYRPDPSPSDDEETLFLPGEQLLTEVDAGLNIEETGTQGRAGDQEQQTSTHSRGTKQRRKPKKRPTPLPSSSLSIEDPTPLPVDFDFPILTSVYWGNCPTTSEEYGTVEGENARLWMQAETDLALEDAPEVPVPGQKRPIDLLDVLDKRLRKIHSAVFRRTGNVGYTWFLVFSTTRAAIPKHCEKGYYRIEITPNREVISDVLFNGLDECQVEDIRQAIHPFFERLHTVPNIPSVFAPQAFPDLVAHDVCFVAPELQQKACRIMVFLQSMLHTRMIMRSGVRVYQNALLEWIGYRSFSKVAMKGKDSLYKGGSLVAVTSHAGHYSLDPSQTLQKDVQAGFFNTVRVPPSAAALLRCIEVLDTVYVRTGSRRKAWLALSRKADHENGLAENGTAFTPLPNLALSEDLTAYNKPRSRTMCDECRRLRSENPSHPLCDRKLPQCSACEASALPCSYPGKKPPGSKCDECRRLKRYCNLEEPTCSTCRDYGLRCTYDGDAAVGTGGTNAELRASKSLKRLHRSRMRNAGYQASYIAFRNVFLQDVLDQEYPSGARKTQALDNKKSLVFDAWLTFMEQWKIGESEFVDAYSGVTQPYFESKSDWEARFPFLLSPDAIQPLCVYEGELAIHVVSNMLPTTWCLNKLKHIYGPILLHLMWQLSHSSASEQRLVIHRKIDHLYLIRLQLPYKRSSRMNLDPEDPLIVSVQTQNTAGIANPDECLKIKRPWALQSDNKTFSKSGRPTESRARVREFPLQSKVEALVLQIEERYNYAFKRIEGAVYLFNWDNRPVEWTWDDNRRFYSVMLERMIEECNKDYETTCTVDTLFLVHCLRVACPPKGLEWLYYELEPYTHHPFRASGGHAAHGLNMTTGWPEDYETLNDFVEEDCNIDIEPWIWNMMRGGLDHHYDAIVDYIRNLPRDNPPYWQESLGSGPPVPLTVWGGAVRQVRLRAKKRGPTGSTSGPDQPQETAMRDTGRQSSQRNVPTGAPQRGNLSNKDQICYASAIIQMLCNVPKLRALVSATSDLPFDVNTGRGLHGFVLLGDPGFAIHQSIFSQLRQIASTLEATNTRLPADCTLEFLRTLRQINTQTCREFPEAGEYDPSTLLGVLLEMLNDAGDRSQPLTDTVELRPNRVWLKNQEEAIKAGRLIAPLIEDVPLQFGIHKDIGNNSEVDDLCTLRVVYESVCSVEGCQSPFSRGFSFEQVLNLQFPQNDPAGVYKVSDLIENWSLGSGRAVCGYDNLHGLAMPAKKKILTTPEILFLRIERLSLGDLMTSGSIFEAENAAQIVSNPLIVEETIDLQPWCNRELPSERHLGPLPERLKPRTTHYGIEAIIQYKSRHFFTYAKAKDQDGNLFWAKFDDTLPTVVWENPLQIKHRTGDFILVYRLLSEAEVSEALAASETISTAHQSEHGEEFEEIEVIENLNAANETGDLSDYEDSIGDPVNIQDILNDDGDASEDDDDGPGDPEARKDNSKIPFEEYSHLKITFEEYSRKSGREKGEYIAGFFTTVAETAGSDGGAEVLFELAARVRFLGEELQAALDSRQSQKSSDREQSDWDAAVMAALQRQPKQFQDYIAELQTEIRKLEKEHQSLKRRLKESQSKTPKPSDDPTSRDDPTPRDDLTPGKRSKSKKKSGSRQPQFSEEEQSARTRLQNLMFEEHTINSQLSSMKKEVEAVREERDHLQQEIDTLRSRDPTSSSGLTSARPEDLVGQLRDQLQNLSPQSLGDLIQQATMELVSRTTMPSETPQKQLPAHVRATPGTQELNPATPFPVVSAPQSTPSTTLPASLSGATGTIPATVSGVGFPFSSDLQSLPTQHQSIGGPGQSTTPAPIFQTPTTPANVSAQPGGFNLPGQPSSTSQPGVMGPPGRTPQTGERRPYEMIRSTEASPSRQGGPESPFKRQFVGTTEPDTSASPSFSTPRHDLGPTPPAQYGAPQHHGAYQAGHTGPGAPPTYFMIPGGFFPYRTAPPPHAYNIQAPTTVPQTAPTAPSTVGSVEPPPTSNLPPSGPPPPAFNVTAPTTVSQAAPTISSNVGSVPAPQPTSRLPVPVRSSGTVAPSPGGTNPPAGPSQRGQEASPSAQPTTLPPPSGTSSGGGTASSQPGQGALPSAQPSTRPSPADTSSETAAGSTKPPQTTEGNKTATGPVQSRPTVPQGPQPPSSLAVRGSGHSSIRGSRPGARGTSGNPLRGNFSRGGRTARGARGARGSDRGGTG
ncbi:hypothetical protein KC333_g4116 [Hortaea werneckii]|nr:hypothetical protein KC333_g4116 [Hortaea werneckii]